MDLRTKLIYHLGKGRLAQIARYEYETESLQQAQLGEVLGRAERTSYGRSLGLSASMSYADYIQHQPLQDYESAKGYIERMVHGERDVLVPGRCRWFAKSSGTTSDRSKYVPVPREHLYRSHFRGGRDALWLYLRNYPDSRFFSTRGLVLGGSHSPADLSAHTATGDLSAILVENMPLLGDVLRVPSRRTLLMGDWTAKMQAVVREVIPQRVGSLSGVPSWMLVMLRAVLAATGRETISEVWPELEVFFHGGISFAPYRATYEALIPSERMRYEETYNASEGFFAIQDDPAQSGMLLMQDYGTFYEFIPLEELAESGSDYSGVRTLRLHEVELGRTYALVITSLGGLYRYLIGDTVRFTSLRPHRIEITGRTKHYINAFGEELMVANADAALSATCERTGAQVSDYTAAPHFLLDKGKGWHDWLIEFTVPPADETAFIQTLDEELRRVNSDYDAKRYADMTLLMPRLYVARPGTFTAWLAESGKLGGQHKIPRLSNHRRYLEEMLSLQS